MRARAQDGNAGLLKLALAAHAMRAIQRLTQTYMTLPLAAIAHEAGLASAEEAEHYLLRCVPFRLTLARRGPPGAPPGRTPASLRVEGSPAAVHAPARASRRAQERPAGLAPHPACRARRRGAAARPGPTRGARARMVDAGDIFAQIDAGVGMVRFLEDPETYDSAAAVARIDDAVQRSMALSQRLQAAHRVVRARARHASRFERRSAAAGAAFGGCQGRLHLRGRLLDCICPARMLPWPTCVLAEACSLVRMVARDAHAQAGAS